MSNDNKDDKIKKFNQWVSVTFNSNIRFDKELGIDIFTPQFVEEKNINITIDTIKNTYNFITKNNITKDEIISILEGIIKKKKGYLYSQAKFFLDTIYDDKPAEVNDTVAKNITTLQHDIRILNTKIEELKNEE